MRIIAVFINAFFPGLGTPLVGKWRQAFIQLALTVLGIGSIFWVGSPDTPEEERIVVTALGLLYFAAVWAVASAAFGPKQRKPQQQKPQD